MKLLLHACCGPCSLEPVRLLFDQGHHLTLYYINSNIAPAREYEKRFDTLYTWAVDQKVPIIEGPYDPQAWERTIGRMGDRALEQAKERLAAQQEGMKDALCAPTPLPLAIKPQQRRNRCRMCYRQRFEQTAAFAYENGFDAIGTTLSISSYQYLDAVQEELERAAAKLNLAAVFQDYRRHYERSQKRSHDLGMYHQNYCGCRFSADEAQAERSERKKQRRALQQARNQAQAPLRAAQEEQRAQQRAERKRYDEKQARKRAILKALREQEKQQQRGSVRENF